MYWGEESRIFSITSGINKQATKIKLITSITEYLKSLAKIAKLLLAFATYYTNIIFIGKHFLNFKQQNKKIFVSSQME
jgi:hypothetical protein